MRFLFLAVFLVLSIESSAQAVSENPLLQFSPLIGNEWSINNSTQTFEWGAGNKSVHSQKNEVSADGSTYLSETVWVWHPQKKAIIGSEFTNNPSIDFIEHEAYFSGDSLISSVSTYPVGISEVVPVQHIIVLSNIVKQSSTSSFTELPNTVLTSENPLKPFEFLVGGAWSTPTTYQVFEWGLNHKSIVSELYFVENDSLRHIGDLIWFWHPNNQSIQGYGTATGMGVDLFEYSTQFENSYRMLNVFAVFSSNGETGTQMESLDFNDTDQYKWTHFNVIDGEATPAYSLRFDRIEKRKEE